MASKQAAVVSYYFYGLAVATAVGSFVLARRPDLMPVLFLLLGLLTRRGPVGRRVARTISGVAFVGVVVAVIGTLVSHGEPLRVGLFGHLITNGAVWVMVGLLGVSAVICFLIPWLALVRERGLDSSTFEGPA